jgi:hypothetical protein
MKLTASARRYWNNSLMINAIQNVCFCRKATIFCGNYWVNVNFCFRPLAAP